MTGTGDITRWHPGVHCCNARWEDAYQRFESELEEKKKFRERFRRLGFDDLDRSLKVVDLFCGRGNALRVLQGMGFADLTGVDLSPSLLAAAPASTTRIVADCTDLRFEPGSVDVFVVQGGLHHLGDLPRMLPRCLDEIFRCLAPSGLFCAVEPWDTWFLRTVHALSFWEPARRRSDKLDAFATMVEEERETYYAWLSSASFIRNEVVARFAVRMNHCSWGKWMFVGSKTGHERR